MQHTDYVTEVNSDWDHVNEAEWDALLAQQSAPSPFMSWAYLKAMHDTGCASVDTGWALRLVTLRHQGQLMAACPVYLKNHSYGEYVFDWAWAQAYERHGLDYYPKAVIAVPFWRLTQSRYTAGTLAAPQVAQLRDPGLARAAAMASGKVAGAEGWAMMTPNVYASIVTSAKSLSAS